MFVASMVVTMNPDILHLICYTICCLHMSNCVMSRTTFLFVGAYVAGCIYCI